MTFTHLHIHSEYSLLDSTCRILPLVQRAKEMGLSSLAITDTNVLYGVIPFYKTCLSHGIKPIIGMEVKGVTLGKVPSDKEPYRLTLIAKNQKGYQNLVKISTELQFYGVSVLDKSFLSAHSEGLIALSGSRFGEIERTLVKKGREAARQVALEYKNVYGTDFYMELQRSGGPNDPTLIMNQKQLAQALEMTTVVTHDVHYLEKEEALGHLSLSCIRQGLTLEEVDIKRVKREAYMKTPQEMATLFPEDQDALDQTSVIASLCDVTFDFNQTYLPKYPVPDAQAYLMSLCKKGAGKRYGVVTEEITKRLMYELAIIDRMGFNDYFLVIWDLIRFARSNGIDPGPGRGSAAGSLVAYVLGITDVDPILHHLLFERFLNPERVSLPDIDIDFPDNRRDEVLRYVQRRYGVTHVAQIGTFGTLSAKAALRDLGRVLSMKPKDLDQLIALIPSKHGITLEEAYTESARLQQLLKGSDAYARLFSLAKMIEGIPRHSSIHAAGVLINDFPLTELVPLQEGREGFAVTQFPMDDLESLGLIKMDFLGLRNLTLIEEILVNIESEGQARPKLQEIPMNDRATLEMLSRGETDGVFQLESAGMRDVLKRLKPTSFEDIVAVCALYRPGPMQNIPAFIEGKHGKRTVHYPHPDLKPILEPTYGVIVYQEQIMRIASVMAGFSLGEADLLRRAVAKKKREILLEEKEHFVKGCLKNGHKQDIAEKVYEWIVRFADYGFNRSHAVAYAVIAYRLAYLKAHYPGAFITALLSSVGHQPEKLMEYTQVLREKGLALFLPSVNKSQASFTNEPGGVRFGLSAIKHLGTPAVKEILEGRAHRPYRNLIDFCSRLSSRKVTRRAIEALIMAGAMDEFGVDRAHLLATLDLAIERAEETRTQEDKGQSSFLGDEGMVELAVPDVPPFTFDELLMMEKETLGFYVSGHPADQYQTQAESWGAKPVEKANVGKGCRLAVMVEALRLIKTKKGQQMAFGRVSDATGQLDVVLFPDTLNTYRSLFNIGELLFVEGTIEKRKETGERQLRLEKAIKLTQLKPIENKISAPTESVYLRVKASEVGLLQKLKSFFTAYPGPSKVIIHYQDTGETLRLSDKYGVTPKPELMDQLTTLLGEGNVIRK
ncbi:MAG TPA: DNA polymerase III subunit alpha [Sporolactobacillaceae bacterium]|nr:DNA polymerase III subunit alpha [Sporolactobacillaceae bacterium]